MRNVALVCVASLATHVVGQTCVQKVVLDSFGGGRSNASNVSADGRVVVGSASLPSTRFRAFRWTAETGMENLGVVAGIQSTAEAVSNDGNVVVGASTTDNTLDLSPSRWTRETGMVAITPLRGRCTDVSADGSVIIGEFVETSTGWTTPFCWTASTGVVPLPLGPGFLRGSAIAVSPDGLTILGSRLDAVDGERTFLWTQAGGVVYPPIVAGEWPEVYDMTADASMIVGAAKYAEWDLREQAFSWTASSGTTYMHTPVARTSLARAVTPDGRFTVGNSYLYWGVDHAVRWSKESGVLDLGTIHTNYSPSRAYDVSADGSVVVGVATNASNQNRAVIWTIRDLGTDFNRDGFVDFFDYDAFVTCFEGGSCPGNRTADYNRDDFVDFFDYDDFVTAYQQGC